MLRWLHLAAVRAVPPPAAARLSTSARRPAPLPPLVWFIVRPITKLAAVLFGRSFRKWWHALPSDKQGYFKESVRRNWRRIAAASVGVVCVSAHYYYSHLQETPLTGRRRFLAFTADQIDQIAVQQFELELAAHGGSVLPPHHPAYARTVRAANRLLAANQHLAQLHDKQWSVTVVAGDEVNAYVLPCGNIFVYTGMLEFCANEEQLGCVLSHEMAHAILGHGAERLSRSHLVELALVAPLAAVWALLPGDTSAAAAHWLCRRAADLLASLPHSRRLEAEADAVGLQLAARACFDVREASAYWSKMEDSREMSPQRELAWLSTHPANEQRRQAIDGQLPALQLTRQQCQCGPLPALDPRSLVAQFRERRRAEIPAAAVPQSPPPQASTDEGG